MQLNREGSNCRQKLNWLRWFLGIDQTTEIIKSFVSDLIRCFTQFPTDPVRTGLAPVSCRSYLGTTLHLRGPLSLCPLHWHPRAEQNLGVTEHGSCTGAPLPSLLRRDTRAPCLLCPICSSSEEQCNAQSSATNRFSLRTP